jgi:exodeoxyribonuclease V alpha subunit
MKPSRQTLLVPGGSARVRLQPAAAYPQDFADLVQDSDLDETRAYLAWQLADMARGLSPGERRAFLVLCGRLLAAEGQGSTRLALTDEDRALAARVPELVGQGPGNTPLVMVGGHLYTRRSHACEARVVTALANRLNARAPFAGEAVSQALHDVVAAAVPTPSTEQQAAVVQALGRQIGIISGGPGTGKTTTALTLLRCWSRLGIPAERIALCAPTGKAASRMEDDVRRRLAALATPADKALLLECPKAQTLHRLLGARTDVHSVFRMGDQPLPFRAVIVDESSMVDLVLMDRLLAALPEHVPLVLLGDADQLPSVSAGAVFRDLVVYAARLAHGFRTDMSSPAGQRLSALAQAVRSGDAAALSELCSFRRDPSQLRHDGVEHIPHERRSELLRRYHHSLFANHETRALVRHVYGWQQGGFDLDDTARLDLLAGHLAKSRILTVTRERATGASQTNAFLHDLHGGGAGFVPGEPVLMLRNDYQRELWNGDQGVAILLRRPGQPATVAVAFRSRAGWQAVDPGVLGEALDHGYALTAHKAQGSEFDEVLFLLPDAPSPLVTRELLYTAVSRARRNVVLCGPAEMMALAVGTSEARDSGVAPGLAALVTPTT